MHVPTPAPPLLTEHDELVRLIRARFPLVFLEASEEARAERLVLGAGLAAGRPCWTWSVSQGLVREDGSGGRDDPHTAAPSNALRTIIQHTGDGVYVMRDLASHVADDRVVERLLRDIAHEAGRTVVVLGSTTTVPASLRTVSATWVLPRPDAKLLEQYARATLDRLVREHGATIEIDESRFGDLVRELRGLTLPEVDQVLLHAVVDDHRVTVEDIAEAGEARRRLLASTGVLALESAPQGLEWVAGFANVKQWVARRSGSFSDHARSFGLQVPKGILLTGVPGCGKSFAAKAIAHDWNLPLLRLDGGSLYDSFIGASERNLRDALATAGALAPSILWIDELEKGFGSTGPSQSDGGLAYRLLGTLATWMQERPHPVVLIATSNDITKLPPELTRQGRFDEVFFVDLPDEEQRAHVFALQVAARRRDPARFDCTGLAHASAGFSGAEIDQAVTNGMFAAYAAGRDLTTADILAEIAATRPLSVVNAAAIDAIRAWGSTHARPA